jgi:uncharacterized protein (DUF433 family)
VNNGVYHFIGVGIYSVPEASRLTGVSAARIRRWLKGYSFKLKDEVHPMPPVWEAQLPPIDGELALGFLDLVEVRFVDAFLIRGVSWHTLRLAARQAKMLFDTSHPFSTKRFKTDGRNIFAEIIQETKEKSLLDLVKSQYAFEKVVAPGLAGLEFAGSGESVRWWPLQRSRRVVIDPARAFGKPILDKEGVPTSILAQAYRIEQSVERVAHWYEVDPRSVRAAIQFEEKLAA